MSFQIYKNTFQKVGKDVAESKKGAEEMSEFDFRCRNCAAIILPQEVCPHGNCQDCQEICCRQIETKFCDDPNCTCRMKSKNFHAISAESARRAYEFD